MVWGLGFGVWGLGLGFWGLGSLGFGIQVFRLAEWTWKPLGGFGAEGLGWDVPPCTNSPS